MRVETVRGAMAVDGLGTTLMHEHVFVLTPDVMQNYGHEWRWALSGSCARSGRPTSRPGRRSPCTRAPPSRPA